MVLCLTWDEWSYLNYCYITLWTIRPEDSRALNFSMSGGKSPRRVKNGYQGELASPTLMSSYVHHSLHHKLSLPPIERAKENALNNPPCLIIPTLTSSSVHDFISSIDYNVCIICDVPYQNQFYVAKYRK